MELLKKVLHQIADRVPHASEGIRDDLHKDIEDLAAELEALLAKSAPAVPEESATETTPGA